MKKQLELQALNLLLLALQQAQAQRLKNPLPSLKRIEPQNPVGPVEEASVPERPPGLPLQHTPTESETPIMGFSRRSTPREEGEHESEVEEPEQEPRRKKRKKEKKKDRRPERQRRRRRQKSQQKVKEETAD